MKPGIPWSIKGIESETREVAKAAAQRSGVTLGQWLNSMIQEQAEAKEAFQKSERKLSKKPANRSKKRKKPASKKVSEFDNRLAALADQLKSLSEQGQSTAVNRFIGHNNEFAVEQALDAMIERIERGETQTHESFQSVNTRLDTIDTKLSGSSKKDQDPSAEFQALETALRNIVDHVETSEKRNRDALNNMQNRMSEMSKRAEDAQSNVVNQSAPAIAALDTRIAELSNQLEVAANSNQDETRSYLEERLVRVGEQIDAVRHSSDAMTKRAEISAVDAAKREAREVEQRVAGLIGEARTLMENATAPGSGYNSMRGEIESLNQRFDDIKAEAASDQDVQSLKLAIEQLTSSVSTGHDMQPVAVMEQRLADLTHRLDQRPTADHMAPQVAELEQRIVGLDQQLSVAMGQMGQQGDSAAFSALESQIAMIGERMSATEQKLGALTDIEQSIGKLYAAMEDNKAEVRNVAEETVSRMAGEFAPAGVVGAAGNVANSGPSPELAALEKGLAAVKQTSRDAEQHNQETLEAVHETLEQIITKLADMEARDVETQAAQSQAPQQAHLTEQPEELDQADSANTDWHATVQSHLQENFATAPATAPTESENVSSAFNPGPVPQTPVQQENLTETFEQEVFEQEVPAEPSPAPLDYIAQARLASQTATAQTKSTVSGGVGLIAEKIMSGRKQDDNDTNKGNDDQSKGLKSLFSLPFMSKVSHAEENGEEANVNPDSGQTVAQTEGKEEKKGSRKHLILAGLILLIAAGSFAINKFSADPAGKVAPTASAPATSMKPDVQPGKTPAPEKTSQTTPSVKELAKQVAMSLKQPSIQARTADQTGMPAAKALQTGNQNTDPVSAAPVDPITTASIPAASSAAQNGFGVQVADILPDAVGTTELRQAAINGDPSAQFVVATRFVDGKKITRDYAKAALWYQKAASAGLAPAQYRLGTLFERGNGVPKDSSAARLWYERAAENGNVKAMHNLAVIYASPNGGQTNYAKAGKWFEKAANFGLQDSQYNLAVIHERGMIGQPSHKDAYFWYSLAAAAGDRDAGAKASTLKKALSAADIKEIDQRRASWVRQKAPKQGNYVAIKDPRWNVAGRRTSTPVLGEKPNLSGTSLIKKTQMILSGLGFDIGKADGVMGSRTANAVRLFQLQNGLQVNGMVTNGLLQQLQARG